MIKLGPSAVQKSGSAVNHHLFWASVSVDFPNLATLLVFMCLTVNLAGAERNNSIYSLIQGVGGTVAGESTLRSVAGSSPATGAGLMEGLKV
ncbi:hypothetical protein PoB_007251700 [Plakobranchus ocellatus]|uniref:Uncharacterized protein n=1 Tax=Plakobranchus ocellatus TaxID=259542 RepID=A0AAV4DPH7_9GAST|nr:hypothetical protein PoB_007251700 [Plakobranchus ocellatus]